MPNRQKLSEGVAQLMRGLAVACENSRACVSILQRCKVARRGPLAWFGQAVDVGAVTPSDPDVRARRLRTILITLSCLLPLTAGAQRTIRIDAPGSGNYPDFNGEAWETVYSADTVVTNAFVQLLFPINYGIPCFQLTTIISFDVLPYGGTISFKKTVSRKATAPIQSPILSRSSRPSVRGTSMT